MAYCTLSDIKDRIDEEVLIQLTDDEGLGVINEDRVSAAIDEADAEIDSYLSARYTVPLTPIPTVIKTLSVAIAIWNLYSRRGIVDEMRQERYKAAVGLLEKMAKGVATLGVDPEPSGGEQQVKTSRTDEDRTFTIGKKSTGESGSLDNY
jgi:phage gp36-like protein